MLGNRKINQLYLSVLVVVLALGLVSGCRPGPVDSDIGTDSIHASMLLRCIGDGTTRVEVELSVGGASGPHIYLAGGDRLIAVANGQSQLLVEERDWPNIVRHLTAFQFDDPGTQVTISLERPNPDYVPAPNSHVTVPESITIQTPQSDENFTHLDDITVSWEPSGGSQEMAIEFEITCQDDQDVSSRSRRYAVSDSGSETYLVDDLLSGWSLGANASCTAEITLMRETIGSLSAEYRSGGIAARRDASVSVIITP